VEGIVVDNAGLDSI